MILRSTLGAFLCVACSNPPQSNAGCTLDFSGNLTASETAATCASLEKTAGTDVLLVIDTTSPTIGRLQASVDLGPKPTSGSFTSDVVTSWDAVALGFGDANCSLSAGNANVPSGSFELALDSIPHAGPDAGADPPHGSITLVLYVHAPPGANCGPIDFENVHVRF